MMRFSYLVNLVNISSVAVNNTFCRRCFRSLVLQSHTYTGLAKLPRQSRLFTLSTKRLVDQTDKRETQQKSCHLSTREVLRLAGPDTPTFLQGLVTNDLNQLLEVSPQVQYCMMLNVQGRVLYDLFLYNITQDSSQSTILVDVDQSVKDELIKLFKKYKLRKKVDISDVSSEFKVYANWGQDGSKQAEAKPEQFIFNDPRVPVFANRIVSSNALEIDRNEGEIAYRLQRYQWGIPEGVFDLPPGNCLPLESNLALMNGVSFQKGCYIGQELTARTFHTGVTRKRLMPVVFEREAEIEAGATITTDKGKNAGKFRNGIQGHGLGLLRLAHINDSLSVIGQKNQEVALKPQVPSWWPPNILSSTS